MEKLADINAFESLFNGGCVSIQNRVDKYGRIIRDQSAPTDMSMGYPTTTFSKINDEYAAKHGRPAYPVPTNKTVGVGKQGELGRQKVPQQKPPYSREINPYSEQARKGHLQSAIGLLADAIGTFRVTGLSREQILQIINKMVSERL